MTPDPLEIGKFIILLGALAGIYLKIQASLRQMAGKGEMREISPNPLPVTHAARQATMDDILHLERRLVSLENRFDSHMTTNAAQIERVRDDITELRDRVDDKMDANAELLHGYAETLRQIERAIGRLENA